MLDSERLRFTIFHEYLDVNLTTILNQEFNAMAPPVSSLQYLTCTKGAIAGFFGATHEMVD